MSAQRRQGSRTYDAATCPDRANHTPQPAGYMAWHTWASSMNAGHRQVKCQFCGLFVVWLVRGTNERVTRWVDFGQPCLTCPAAGAPEGEV